MIKVLIIDESQIIRKKLVDTLSNNEMIEIIGETDSVTKGLEFIYSYRPDYVIIDADTRKGSSIYFLRELNKLHFSTKVVVLTDYPYLTFQQECYELGVDYFFDKSFEFEKIKSAIK